MVAVFNLLLNIDNVNLNVLYPVYVDVDEFRKVDGAVCGSGVVNEDGWAVVAIGVKVREIHLRKR